jgi:hypothetical protein
MRYVYFAVEGTHDVEFVGRFLKLQGLKRVQQKPALAPFWIPLLPKTWPPKDSTDLLARVPVPVFFQGGDISVAIDSANGDGQLLTNTIRSWQTLDQPGGVGLHAIGIVLDADQEVAEKRFARISQGLAEAGLPQALAPGQVVPGPPRVGIFVLPDNVNSGTLEDLLIDCAGTQYPQLLASARTYIDSVKAEVHTYEKSDVVDFRKPAGRQKALVGAMGSVLRPGKAIQVSIQDNRWVEGDALELPRVKRFREFVEALLAP